MYAQKKAFEIFAHYIDLVVGILPIFPKLIVFEAKFPARLKITSMIHD